MFCFVFCFPSLHSSPPPILLLSLCGQVNQNCSWHSLWKMICAFTLDFYLLYFKMCVLYSFPFSGATAMQSTLAYLHNSEVELARMLNQRTGKGHNGHIIQPSSSSCFFLKYVPDSIIHYCLNHPPWSHEQIVSLKGVKKDLRRADTESFFNVWQNSLVKTCGPGLLFVDRSLIMVSNLLICYSSVQAFCFFFIQFW